MLKVMTHAEFIEYARGKGIQVGRVTRTRVHVLEPDTDIPSGVPEHARLIMAAYIPSAEVLGCARSKDGQSSLISRKVKAIKAIRNETGMGLWESKVLLDANWARWGVA